MERGAGEPVRDKDQGAPLEGVQVAETHVTGNVGLTQAILHLQRLNWGPVDNTREDAGSGIDLFVSAREGQRVELGRHLSAQVKGGESWFKEPGSSDGRSGWYFRIPDRLKRLWVSQPIPHLVVLCNLETETSYWVHVTNDAVISTGKHWKILVPADQKIDEDARGALEAVAASAAIHASGFAGSAWAPPPHLGDPDRWRCALVAPRLVAPHPNLGHRGGLTAVQGVALIVAARAHDYFQYAETHKDVPSLTDAAQHDSREWRFVWALHAWYTERDLAPLTRALSESEASHELAVATVATANALIEQEELRDAQGLLDESLANALLANDIDRCWLLVQKARVVGDMGRGDEAVAAAVDAYDRLRDARSIPATAIRAAAVALWWRFAGAWTWSVPEASGEATTTGEGSLDGPGHSQAPIAFDDLIVGIDTHAAWWRAQMASGALSHYLRDDFLHWAQAHINRVGMYDQTRVGLQAATRTASYAGDAGSAAGFACDLARYDMIVATTEEETYHALNELRRVGDEDAIKHAVTHVWQQGPLGALKQLARDLLDERRWSRSSCLANLRVWAAGADLFDEADANEAITFCLGAFGDSKHPFSARARAGFHLRDELIEAIASILPAASAGTQAEVAEWFMEVCREEPLDGLREMSAPKLLSALRWAEVPGDIRQSWLEWAAARDEGDYIATLLLARLSNTMETATEVLLERAQAGNLMALIRAWPEGREVPPDIATPLIERLSQHLDKRRAEMEAYTYTWEGVDRAAHLAWLNVHCPQAADWDVLVRFLISPAVAASDKTGTCRYLASPDVKIPEGTQRALADAREALEVGSYGFFGADDGSLRSAGFALGHKLGAVKSDRFGSEVVKLAASRSPSDRMVAIRIVRDIPQSVVSPHLLVALLGDDDSRVAMAAASGLSLRASQTPNDLVLEEALISALRAPGAALAQIALGWVERNSELRPNVIDAIRECTKHASAQVRRGATKVMANLPQAAPET
jgi:hypothetical protein